MPIVAVFEFPGEEIAKYHEVFEAGGDAVNHQPQRLSHICFTHDDGFTVVDVWEDEAAFAAFGAVIGPATQAAGLDGAGPTVHPLVGSISQDGVRTVH